jgi:hypothetical protein
VKRERCEKRMERVRECVKGRECMAIGRSPQDVDNERERERNKGTVAYVKPQFYMLLLFSSSFSR